MRRLTVETGMFSRRAASTTGLTTFANTASEFKSVIGASNVAPQDPKGLAGAISRELFHI